MTVDALGQAAFSKEEARGAERLFAYFLRRADDEHGVDGERVALYLDLARQACVLSAQLRGLFPDAQERDGT